MWSRENGQAFVHVYNIYLLGLNLLEPQCFTSYFNNIDFVKPSLQLLIELSYMDWPKIGQYIDTYLKYHIGFMVFDTI